MSTPLYEVISSLIALLILSFVTYFLGSSKRRFNKNPFACGETVPSQRVRYLLPWSFFVIVFSALDASLLLITLTSMNSTPFTLIGLIALLTSLLLIPWGEK